MRKSFQRMVEEIKSDRELRSYFIDYLGENLKMTFGKSLDLDQAETDKFLDEANNKLSLLMSKLEARVPKKHVDFVLEEVCFHYASMSVVTPKRTKSVTSLETWLEIINKNSFDR